MVLTGFEHEEAAATGGGGGGGGGKPMQYSLGQNCDNKSHPTSSSLRCPIPRPPFSLLYFYQPTRV